MLYFKETIYFYFYFMFDCFFNYFLMFNRHFLFYFIDAYNLLLSDQILAFEH
jgi:hypothetical protein